MQGIVNRPDTEVPSQVPLDRYQYIHFLDKSIRETTGPKQSACAASDRRTPARPAGRWLEEPLEPEFERFLEWVLRETGVDFRCYRTAPLARRLRACLRSLHVGSVQEAWNLLQREPQRLPVAISALLIGVTQFFREPEVFAFLQQNVLPALAAERAGLRVMSVGCSDGAELYSIAMFLARAGFLKGSTLLGIDCRAEAIRRARRGWFEASRLEGLEPGLVAEFLIARRRGWQVCDRLREAVCWRQGDAVAVDLGGEASWDLVLCRNLAIYLEPSAAARLWAGLARSLRPGGILVLGKAERPEGQPSLVRLGPCLFEKRG